MAEQPQKPYYSPKRDSTKGYACIGSPSTESALSAFLPAKREHLLKRWLAPSIPFLMLALFAILLLWPLCMGRTLYWGDILLYFEPMQRFAQHELRAGRLPLWNPYIMAGQPFIGNPQMSVFYPATGLLFMLPVWLALSISTLVHLFFCGTFMYLFLRRWTVRSSTALAGAGVYMGSACVLGRLQFPPMLATAVYFPLLFMLIDRHIDRPTLNLRLAIAAATALTILAGHSQVAYLAFTAVTAYTSARLWRQRGGHKLAEATPRLLFRGKLARSRIDVRHLLTGATPIAVSFALGLFIAAIYLLPALQLLHESSREKMSIGQANRFFADVPHVLSWVFPWFSGHPASRDYWARGNAWEPALFVGWIPLLLTGYALLCCRKEKMVRFWLVLGGIGIWLALGSNGGLYWLAFYTAPGVANFHDPARFLLWTTVSLSVLTSVGLDRLRSRVRWCGFWTVNGIVIGIYATLLWFCVTWNPTTSPGVFNLVPRGLSALQRSLDGQRMFLGGNTLFWRRVVSDGYSDYGNTDLESLQRTTDTFLSNLEMRQGIESVSGYEPVPIGAHISVEGLWRLAQQRREPYAAALLGTFNARILALPIGGAIPPIEFIETPAAMPMRLWKNTRVLPRMWLTRNVYRVDGKTRTAAALTNPDFDPARSTIVYGLPATYLSNFRSAIRAGSNAVEAVQWRSTGIDRTEVSVDAGSAPVCLVYSETAYPGWKAELDGRLAPVWRADGDLLGLMLTPGKHRGQFIYSPDTLRVGAYLSLLAMGTFPFILFMHLCRARRSIP